MTAADVAELCAEWQTLGIAVWVDGGWGVDALLGRHTRPHRDLDIAVQEQDTTKLLESLSGRGYKETARDSRWNFVLADARGREVDVHVFVFDAEGNVVQGTRYAAESLTGNGAIYGQSVRCISAEWMVKYHTGYAVRDTDIQDVRALCRKFGIPLPQEYLQTDS